MPPKTVVRLPLIAALTSVALAACLETVNTGQGPATGTVSVAASTSEQLRQRLERECVYDTATVVGVDDKISKQCGCYAASVVKSLRKDDLEYFAAYGVVPTVVGSKPEDVKKRCGMAADAAGVRPRTKQLETITN